MPSPFRGFRRIMSIERSETPKGAQRVYWNFWKVVLAGWLIKYPGKIFSGIFWCLLLFGMGVVYIITPSDTQNVIENEVQLPSEELRDTYRNYYEKNVFNFFTE